jgi:catechol 2,3-dioxygenase-like lactoylglutathione lyase family enzyme
MKIIGIHHIELTVTDLQRSKDFYSKIPGFKIVAEYSSFVMLSCGNLYLGLTDHNGKQTSERFSELNIGLDHVAFAVESYDDLVAAWELGMTLGVDMGEIQKLSNGTHIVVFRDPDNIQLEFAWRG